MSDLRGQGLIRVVVPVSNVEGQGVTLGSSAHVLIYECMFRRREKIVIRGASSSLMWKGGRLQSLVEESGWSHAAEPPTPLNLPLNLPRR